MESRVSQVTLDFLDQTQEAKQELDNILHELEHAEKALAIMVRSIETELVRTIRERRALLISEERS